MTGEERLPYGRPCLDERDVEAVAEVLRGDWLTTGPTVEAFETALAERCGAGHARTLNSGTSALHAAYAAAGVGPGTEVVVPALTFSATASAAVHLGADLRFADIEEATLTVDPASVAEAVTERTRVIVAVDFGGHPARLDELASLAEGCGAVLVEDAAHGLGASHRGRPVGSVADMTCLSFHPLKVVTTGEGGAVLTDRGAWAEEVGRFRSHGMDGGRAPPPVSEPAHREAEARAGATREAGGWAYDVERIGHNHRLSDIHCALGLSQLAKLEAFVDRRRALAAAYRSRLAELEAVEPPPEAGWAEHAYHLFVVRVPPDHRRRVYEALHEDGIGAQVHYVPANMLSAYRERGHDPRDTPVALRAYRRMLSLPCFPDMDVDDVDRVVRSLAAALDSVPP